MTNFSEMSGLKQWGVVVAGAVLLTAALYFTMFKSQREANEAAQQALDNKVRENSEPMKAGIELRRYTAKPVSAKEFYTEVPFEMELDGPYYSMLSFFDRVGKLERIVNVSALLVSTTKKPGEAKTK